MFKKLRLLSPCVFTILFLICVVGITDESENIKRTIKVNYDKTTTGETTVVAVPGAEYTFVKGTGFPAGASIEWKDQTTDRGSWPSDNVLIPYGPPKAPNKYTITAVLVGEGEGDGPGWEYTVNGAIANPILTYDEPGEDTYFAKGQTEPTPQVDLTVTVTKPGGTPDLEGVSVLFIAKKSDDSIVSIGSDSSDSSGEATKTWNVPVSAVEVYTLKAGTGNDPESLENEVTGKKVYVFGVNVTSLDPTTVELGYDTLDINYTISPSGFTADTIELGISKGDDLVYKDTTIAKTSGSHDASWNGKKNQSPHSGLYVNANNSPYVVKITIEKDGSQHDDSENVAVQAKAISGVAIVGYGGTASTIGNKINALGYTPVHIENGFTRQEANSHTPKRLVWYILAHGSSGNIRMSDDWLQTSDLPSGLDYTLVFMNACESATGGSGKWSKFNADAYVGWDGEPNVSLVLSPFGGHFFDGLKEDDGFKTVNQAITHAIEETKNNAGAYNPHVFAGSGGVKVRLP